jgi:hypothetical protein
MDQAPDRFRKDDAQDRKRRGPYETPDIVYEGDLEVHAGTVAGEPGFDEMMEEW